MYRLLAIDLDDTLLTPEHTITPATLAALQRAVNAGIILVIATGRVPYMLPSVIEQLPLNGPQITSNGAVILDGSTRTILSEQLLPMESVRLALDEIRRFQFSYCYYARQRMYVDSTLYNSFGNRRPSNSSNSSKSSRVQENGSLDLYLQPCIKLAAFIDAASLREKRQEFEHLFAGQFYLTQTASNCLEFLHPEVSKANALKTIIDTLDVRAEEVIAFGDNDNDIEMLRLAGVGVAMGNAQIEVKAVANYVTLSNREDGIATALEKFLFSEPNQEFGQMRQG